MAQRVNDTHRARDNVPQQQFSAHMNSALLAQNLWVNRQYLHKPAPNRATPFPRNATSTAKRASMMTGTGSAMLRRRVPVDSVWLMLPVASE